MELGSGSQSDVQLDDILLRVGRLNYTWTNTESLLIHLMAGLAGVEKDVAVVLFLTLNTTRARVDLVERLSKLPKVEEELRDEVLALTNRLVRQSTLRNKYNHCIYSFDPDQGRLRTIMMRIQDRRKDIKVGKMETITPEETENIDACIANLERLNTEIWALVQRHGFPA
ncbi:hypothetical protein GFB49_18950 [Epibacterium sp. SM1979]|uniref:Uncharacterized protein n=1 Tax=Tritonibacter litoralis TaxID=2662264 RepID=A0A843YM97_9RHOB|nr:hypothetical protein [Tritonibacter litoralis]MQQ10544.1 hypothetical protein [Tritonibacter litoralis]